MDVVLAVVRPGSVVARVPEEDPDAAEALLEKVLAAGGESD